MKKLFIIPMLALAFGASSYAAPTTTATATADNPLSGILGGLSKGGSSSGSGLGDALGGIVGGLLSNDKIAPEKLVGTWSYVDPAVCFKSENFLQKAGGAAVAGTIEGKLEPYYNRFGLNKLVLTVDKDMNFTMQAGKIKAGGTVIIEGTDVYFNFSALGKISLGKIKTYVTMTGGSQMSVMFDVTKLITIVKAVGSISGSSAVSTMTSLLESYDGICAGFKLKKQ